MSLTRQAGRVRNARPPARSGGPYFRLRPDAWRHICQQRGWMTFAEVALELGVRDTTIHRIVFGKVAPGVEFIAACTQRLGVRVEDLFEVVNGAGEK